MISWEDTHQSFFFLVFLKNKDWLACRPGSNAPAHFAPYVGRLSQEYRLVYTNIVLSQTQTGE